MKSTLKIAEQGYGLKAVKTLKTYGMIWMASSLLAFDVPLLAADGFCPSESYSAGSCCPDSYYPTPCSASPCCSNDCNEIYSTDVGGCGYQACRRCPVLAPAVALAVVALTGIIAVALQTDHCHIHSSHKNKCHPCKPRCHPSSSHCKKCR